MTEDNPLTKLPPFDYRRALHFAEAAALTAAGAFEQKLEFIIEELMYRSTQGDIYAAVLLENELFRIACQLHNIRVGNKNPSLTRRMAVMRSYTARRKKYYQQRQLQQKHIPVNKTTHQRQPGRIASDTQKTGYELQKQ
jgi:hypothetical protein